MKYQDDNHNKLKISRCPKCKGENIIDYGDSIECVGCNLEFEKTVLESLEDESDALSIEEKLEIIKIFKQKI